MSYMLNLVGRKHELFAQDIHEHNDEGSVQRECFNGAQRSVSLNL
jgi:hypothetical protein